MNLNPTNFQVQDALLLVSNLLPATNTTAASTGSIDTTAVNQMATSGPFDFQITCPATPLVPNGQTLTFTVQDSADGATFAAIPQLAPIVVTGAGGTGGPALVAGGLGVVRLPGSARRYLNVSVTSSATAGANNTLSYVFQLLF